MTSDAIHFIITGGTIDSEWSAAQDTATILGDSKLPQYFKDKKLHNELRFTTVCMKDSRSLDNTDVKNILKAVEESEEKKIIITHGTYTMPDTARYLEANLKAKDKTVILTGSMTPLKGFEFSDAPFNLGYAISKVQDLKPGVYLCMNGRVFTTSEVAKNLAEGKFYSVFADEQ